MTTWLIRLVLHTIFLARVGLSAEELAEETILSDEEQIEEANKPWRQQHHETEMTMLDMNFLKKVDRNVTLQPLLSPKAGKEQLRKDYLCLNPKELELFHSSLLQMKTEMVGENSEYDTFALHHDGSRSPSAHAGPSFVVWHRMLLFLIEKVMQKYSPDTTMVYWDNRLLRRAPSSPNNSVFFSNHLAGTPAGVVRTGAFAKWKISSVFCRRISLFLSRNVTQSISNLYNDTMIEALKSIKTYKDICYPWTRFFEEWHGNIHTFVGGHMRQVMCAPFDPLFYFHHTFVDYLYEEHVRKPILARNATLVYPDIAEFGMERYYDAAYRMLPFGIKHRDMLNSVKFVPKYHKAPGDVVCRVDADCCPDGYSRHVWCHVGRGQCVAKVVEGSKVETNLEQACYCKDKKPAVLNGYCRCV